jgi:aminoglycoside phosphotransferase (APT) family kinase protein
MAIGVRRDEEFSGTKPVEEHHRFDEARLDAWMRENVDGYEGPLVVNQFKGGQSNPTYRLNTPGRSYVMRRKPFGKLLPSAHAVDREYRVIAALGNEGFLSLKLTRCAETIASSGPPSTSCRWRKGGSSGIPRCPIRRRISAGRST